MYPVHGVEWTRDFVDCWRAFDWTTLGGWLFFGGPITENSAEKRPYFHL